MLKHLEPLVGCATGRIGMATQKVMKQVMHRLPMHCLYTSLLNNDYRIGYSYVVIQDPLLITTGVVI